MELCELVLVSPECLGCWELCYLCTVAFLRSTRPLGSMSVQGRDLGVVHWLTSNALRVWNRHQEISRTAMEKELAIQSGFLTSVFSERAICDRDQFPCFLPVNMHVFCNEKWGPGEKEWTNKRRGRKINEKHYCLVFLKDSLFFLIHSPSPAPQRVLQNEKSKCFGIRHICARILAVSFIMLI